MKIKKRVILRLIEELGAVPLGVAAKEMYGRDGELQQIKVIRALNAYRAKDPEFNKIRGKYSVNQYPPPACLP